MSSFRTTFLCKTGTGLLGCLLLAQILTASEPAIQYLFPCPGSDNLPAGTMLIMRFWNVKSDQVTNLQSFCTITGDRSGVRSGEVVRSSDGVTLIFYPDGPFSNGETVSVRLAPIQSGMQLPFVDTTYAFTIQTRSIAPPTNSVWEDEIDASFSSEEALSEQTEDEDPLILNGVSVPSSFPRVQITTDNNLDPNPLFLTYTGEHPYLMILDNTGAPIWYKRLQNASLDFKRQKDGRLTYKAPIPIPSAGHFAMDSTYAVVDTFYVPTGYFVDMHELQVLPNGHYFLIGNRIIEEDLSDLVPGGNPKAQIICNHIFEMDADDNPVFVWNTRDHLRLVDAPHVDLTEMTIDFAHVNAIEIDLDGHILISCRHQESIVKIHRQTGRILWQLGGENDDFTWTNDTHRISYQHDIRVLPNGDYTLLDNGTFHSPPFSRALQLRVNTENWTVTKIWSYVNPSGAVSQIMGGAQRLDNGNTLINWGYNQTEVTQDGALAFGFQFFEPVVSYRVFRFPWDVIAPVPYLVLDPQSSRITLLFNKFGDSDVAYYKIYAGQTPRPEQVIATSAEPFVHLSSVLENNTIYFFRVTAVSSTGFESDYSNEESTLVQLINPSQNMVQNGDFSEGTEHWNLSTDLGIQADYQVDENGELLIQIANGGSLTDDISLGQSNLVLFPNQSYRLEFDAHAVSGRIIEVSFLPEDRIIQATPYWLNQIQNHFNMDFVINRPVMTNAQLVFNVGGSSHDVYVDNIKLAPITAPIANFFAPITQGKTPLSVQFSDLSTGTIDSWSWDFGDGTSSTEQNPTHVYQTIDTFTVSLTVTGTLGEDTKIQTDFVMTFDPAAVRDDPSSVPDRFELSQNYPNPFNASTRLDYAVPVRSHVRIRVYNIRGECVIELVDGYRDPGIHQIHIDASHLGSGLYYCRMESRYARRNEVLVRKMILLK